MVNTNGISKGVQGYYMAFSGESQVKLRNKGEREKNG
jgi:hypothetical protein